MTDDFELRARIEARVAARRAGSSSTGADADGRGDEELEAESPAARTPDGEQPAGLPRTLSPTRAWNTPAGPAAPANPAPARAAPVPNARGPLTPLRPWELRGANAESEGSGASVRAPSHPEVVLEGMAGDAGDSTGSGSRGHRALRWLLARGPEPAVAEPDEAEPDEAESDEAGPEVTERETAPEPEAPAVPVAVPVPAPATARPRPRPSPGPRTDVPSATRHRPAPGPVGIHGVNGTVTPERTSPSPARPGPDTIAASRIHEPDISRFLEASEPRPDDEDERPSRRPTARKAKRLLIRVAIIVVIASVAAVLLRAYVVAPYYIPSESMEPTLHGCAGCNDDHVLVDKISYRIHDPHVTDIVVFDRPAGARAEEKVLIKRVIAVPGDRVVLRKGAVLVNGVKIPEPYLSDKLIRTCGGTFKETSTSRWTIPDGQLFVMGDNRCDSTDSRSFGPIKQSSVVGRAFAIIWPLNRIRIL